MYGLAAAGIARRTLVRIGAIRTTITTRMAGICMKDTGIMMITAITTTIITTTTAKI